MRIQTEARLRSACIRDTTRHPTSGKGCNVLDEENELARLFALRLTAPPQASIDIRLRR
jgi:hypothetical protein